MTPDLLFPSSLSHIASGAEEALSAVSVLFLLFKGYTWVRDNIRGIKKGVDAAAVDNKAGFVAVVDEISKQTSSTVNEIRELRSDFRTFYTQPDPIMIPAHSRAVRKRVSVAERTKAKKKPAPAPKKATKSKAPKKTK